MHRFVIDEKETRKTGEIYDNQADAEKALYKNDEGRICSPASHIESAIAKAATDYKIPGKGRKTFRDLIKSALIVDPLLIPHKITDWKVDLQSVVIQRSRIVRARPRFDKWELDFTIIVSDPRITGAQLKEFLDASGQFIGVGDYRPKYGLFEVTKFEKIK
jgi:hypothetical protein